MFAIALFAGVGLRIAAEMLGLSANPEIAQPVIQPPTIFKPPTVRRHSQAKKGEKPVVLDQSSPNLQEIDPLAEKEKTKEPTELKAFKLIAQAPPQQGNDALPRVVEEPQGSRCVLPDVMVRLGWVDDKALMSVNNEHTMLAEWGKSGALVDGKHDLRKGFGNQPGDTGKIGIQPWVRPGKNTFKVTLDNTKCCGASVYVDIWVGGEHKVKERWVKHYGQTGKSIYDQTFEIDLPACSEKREISDVNRTAERQ